MSKTKVYIAGVGLSPSKSDNTTSALVSAAVKALLDAGVTYDNVTRSIIAKDVKNGQEVFDAFNDSDITVDKISAGSEMRSAVDAIGSGKGQCVLVVAQDKSEAIASVLVSEDFMMRWPYLKDSSILVSDEKSGGGQGNDSLSKVCRAVWQLRGWSSDGGPVKGLKLSRADGQSAPEWKDVEHKQDGKHRLGYNPAKEKREVSREDFEAVGASGKSKSNKDNSFFKKQGGDQAILRTQHKYVAKL